MSEISIQEAGGAKLPLWSVLVGGLVASVALAFALRGLGRSAFDVPSGLPSLATAALLPAAIFPVLGNCFGFFMSFRAKPSAHSTTLFIGVGVLFGCVGAAISASKLPAAASTASVAITLTVAVLADVLIIGALLVLALRSAR